MKIAAIGNEVVLLGLALAGVRTRVRVDTPEEAVKSLEDLSSSGEYGIIFIGSDIYRQIIEEVEEMQERRPIPILIEIPRIEEDVKPQK